MEGRVEIYIFYFSARYVTILYFDARKTALENINIRHDIVILVVGDDRAQHAFHHAKIVN